MVPSQRQGGCARWSAQGLLPPRRGDGPEPGAGRLRPVIGSRVASAPEGRWSRARGRAVAPGGRLGGCFRPGGAMVHSQGRKPLEPESS
jgi:hypothetical protein